MKLRLVAVVTTIAVLGLCPSVFANGLGESRSYQFRSDSQRQVNLTVDRTRLELLGLLGSSNGNGFGGGGTGQVGNSSSVTVSGSNNVITINQTNNGNQDQDRNCSGASFTVSGGMFGC